MSRPGLLFISSLGLVLAVSASAFGYETKNEVGDACHETLTLEALARLRSDHGLAPWLEPQGEDRALVADLPISVQTDLAGATLVLGNRDVDLQGNPADDLDALAPIHGAPENQKKHCLRAPDDDEPDGSATALSACKGFIRDQTQKSLAGLTADGSVDPGHRTTFEPVLDFRRDVKADLPTFYVEMGRALHALQDGFSHQWRTADHQHTTTVLNYTDVINDDYDESRDGPPHSAKLDQCKDLDTFRSARLQTARGASVELMVAALEPASTDAERMARVDAVLEAYLGLQPGCTAANDWCDAPENQYRDPEGCVCTAAGGRARPWGAWPFALGAALLCVRRRRLGLTRRLLCIRLRGSPGAACHESVKIALMGLASLALATSPARAEQDGADAECVSGGRPADKSPEPAADDERFPFGVFAAVGVSATRPAAAVSLGGRYRFSEHFQVGIDGEINPWYSRTTKEFRSGTTNVYSTFVVRFPMDYERVNLRSTLQLGISRMNFDLYGVPKGTVGPYVGFNALGIDFELGRSLYLVVNPAHIAVPMPQLSGVPFSYPQYRITLGIQYGA